jgi:TonB-linked SusC/RagA family outer membrane protein
MKKFFVFSCLLFMANILWSQDITVTGTIIGAEDGAPIPGANVVVKGTTIGTITDLDGNYTISAPPDATLVFSFVGLETMEIPVSNQTVINVSLQMSMEQLAEVEVVAIGYGTARRKDLTSAIATVESEDIMRVPTSQPLDALQGTVAGVQIVNSGAPGRSPTVRIRGIGSYPGDENEAPLYVIDGMFFDQIDFLNPSDIESISVLKDATAAAIYGVRAANGVVLIETKSGSYNQKAQITYDGYYGVQVAQNVLKMANSEQFATMAFESGSAADSIYILNAMQRFGRSRDNPNVPDVNTDWYKEILRPANITNHSLNVTGGSERATYSIGGSYHFEQGIMDMKNEYQRFNLRSKLDYKATDWLTVGGNIIMSNNTRYDPEEGAWHTAYYAVPVMPVYDELNTDATPINFTSAEILGYRGGKNPFTAMTFSENRRKFLKLLGNFYLDFEIIPDKLSFKSTYNQSYTQGNRRFTRLPYYLSPAAQRADATLTKESANWNDIYWDNVLTYTDQFAGDHNLTVMAATSYRQESYQFLKAQGLNFPLEPEQAWYINLSGDVPSEEVSDDGLMQYGLSYFGRLSYNYKYKYYLYGTMRADGSSKYQQKWGYFPSVGVGWVLSEESFLQNVGFLSFLKLRASWGQLGNDKIKASDGAITSTVITTAIDDVLRSGTLTQSTFSSLEWEVVEETNVGLTSRFLGSRLSVELDYYSRDTKNAVIDVKIPAVGGTIMKNVGVIRNSGFEFMAHWRDQITGDLSYRVGANFTTLKNETRDLYGQPYIDGGQAEFRQRTIVGEPLLAFYGREVTGVYQNQAEIDADPVAVANGLEPGDFKYKDQDGDGDVDDDDRVILGSYFPSFMYGFDLGLTWRDLQFSVQMMGQSGNKILNRKRGEVIWTADGNWDADIAKNRWHGEGTSNKYPSSAGLRKGWNQRMSDYFVEDGAFFRVQNVQLAYNIRLKQMVGPRAPNVKVMLTAQRPLTFFKYNGFNPEVADGVDRQTYPIPAVYTVGLNVNF